MKMKLIMETFSRSMGSLLAEQQNFIMQPRSYNEMIKNLFYLQLGSENLQNYLDSNVKRLTQWRSDVNPGNTIVPRAREIFKILGLNPDLGGVTDPKNLFTSQVVGITADDLQKIIKMAQGIKTNIARIQQICEEENKPSLYAPLQKAYNETIEQLSFIRPQIEKILSLFNKQE